MKTSTLGFNDLLWPFRLLALVLPLVLVTLLFHLAGFVFCQPKHLFHRRSQSVADEEAEMQQQMCRASSHLLSDAPRKFDANVQIATTVNAFEIWSHFIPARSASAPRTSHIIKKNMRRPEFSPNEFLIKGSLFFHIFYFFCSKFTHSQAFKATELYVPCPNLNGGSKFGCQFCIHFPKY